ncbi:MAG TPA: nodulation protein NfeD [Noviherbaspirillum sp.]|nr:nodulation protein NfeD [Noviherbaspirillum sp.]
MSTASPDRANRTEKAIIRSRPALFLLYLLLVLAWVHAPARAAPAPVALLTVSGAIGPASADYISRGIARAEREGAQLVVLQMDTPGGLDLSMRTIIKAILAAQVPVATFVGPQGARAASAGTYILYASHVAAMAPGTNLGAATPVAVGGGEQPERPQREPQPEKDAPAPRTKGEPAGEPTTSPSTRKQVNDAAAYIRGLAQMRGRNMEWAERAVREAVSLSAEEAVKQNVVDLVARDVNDLLSQLDGRTINVAGQDRTLETANAQVDSYEPDWRVRFLGVITDPSIALLLMTIGMYGLILEFSNPGVGVPGVLGAISLLLALYALQLLPVNYAGVALILLGLGFMIAEAFVPSFGILGLGGIAAFVTGAVILIDTEVPGYGIPLALILTIAIFCALLVILTVTVMLKTRRRPTVTGQGGLIGSIAEVIDPTPDHGWVTLHGETWRAHSEAPLRREQKVRVTGRDGLVLEVAPIDQDKKGE